MGSIETNQNMRAPAKAVAAELTRIIGAPLVAILGGAKSTRSVRRWITGEANPQQIDRLRLVLVVAELLLAREEPDVVRAWFAGDNTDLGGKNPIMLLAESDSALTRKAVIAAAKNFISGS
jgi:hypothetical protein